MKNRQIIFTILLLFFSVSLQASTKLTLELADGTEISYYHFAANGDKIFIWLAPEAGLQQEEKNIAHKLANQSIEVVYPDLFESNFLPIAASSIDRFPINQIKALIAAANKDKDVYLVTSGRGVVPMLEGLRQWQLDRPENTAIKGVILLSPKFFVETPNPGQIAKIEPITHATNIPIYLFQPAQSPWRWKLDKTIPALQKGGSEVFIQIIPNVRDRFYYRPDAEKNEYDVANELHLWLNRASKVLSTLTAKRSAAPLNISTKRKITTSKKERLLTAYKGKSLAPALTLNNLQGKIVELEDYKDGVVMVNFWASWCPPCVHEMPSMQRLKESMKGKPFHILAINMAENQPTIEKFLNEKVNVDFTVLLDSDGEALKRWEVFAFPTTYFIDKQRRLRYGLFGAREWDKPDIEEIIEKLINES